LSIFGLNPEDSQPFDYSGLPTPANMRALVRGRRSTRQYLAQNVSPAVLEDLLEDLQYAPTGQNLRFLEYLVVDNLEAMDLLREKSIALAEKALGNGLDSPFIKGMVKIYRRDKVDLLYRGAPHLLVISAPAKKQSSPQQDIALALAYFELLAACRGLGTCWCGYINEVEAVVPGLRELLGLKEGDNFYSVLFGLPKVKYRRLVHREGTAKIRRFG
jgi:nitroreductase